ncbi:PEP-CTERM sorting domain-containing protein [Rubritalea marina]|uniref:PEP-CTERM sorting domain-containing protein n=1 Tax=Rubritalea marina TaxID=361055 RepID=UPI0003699FF0|nr:PEP-CTERM sorting domain-containing protein [Rubritalea marina]
MKTPNTPIVLVAFATLSTANAFVTTLGEVTDNGGGSYTISSGSTDRSTIESEIDEFLRLNEGTTGEADANTSIGDNYFDAIVTDHYLGSVVGTNSAPIEPTNGSAIRDGNISITAGESFNFTYDWTDGEASYSGVDYADSLTVVILLNGLVVLEQVLQTTSITGTAMDTSGTNIYFEWVATGTGVLEYGIAQFNGRDTSTGYTSIATVYNISHVGVPEPSTTALAALGTLAMLSIRRRNDQVSLAS